MLRHFINRPTWIALGCATATFVSLLTPVAAQDSQAAAAAKAARDKIAAQNTANTSPSAGAATKSDADTSAATSESLKRKAGERVGSAPRGRSLILGMHVQESSRGGVKVVEVAAASPAFDADIREGDEVVEFAGFHATDYRKWMEGMSRLTTAAKDNSMLPVVVMRRGQRVDAQIRVPEGRTAALTLPLGPMPQPGQPAGPEGFPMPMPGAPPIVGGGGGNDIAIENVGPFVNFFGGDSAPVSERAMAEIFRIGGKQASQDVRTGTPSAAPPINGARIGLAGFRNDSNGMLVMVDVGSLPPGNYSVGLSDPGVVGIQTNSGVAPGAQPSQVPSAGNNDGGQNPPAAPPANPGVTLSPQSNLPPAGQRDIPRNVLAQVSDTTQQPAGVTAPTIPPTGQVQPLTAPPTGKVNPSNTTPTGQSTVNNALVEQANRANAARSRPGASGGPMLNQIGTLTVDQSGTGRMQHLVEGVRVRDVVGQAIVLYAQTGNEQTLPANLDPTVDPAGGKAASDAAQPTGNNPAANAIPTAGASTAPKPVAAGIIRFMSDRRPNTETPPADEEVFGRPTAPVQQPANNTPPIGTNPIR
jgi:hypothetical protein